MSQADVLLFNLPTKSSRKNSMPPLGLLYIATVLDQNGYKVKLVDLAVEDYTKDEMVHLLKETNPNLIGISTYTESWYAQKLLTKLAKNMLPSVKIFCGGAFATFCYETILKESDADFVIKGEGEFPVLKLCDYITKDKQMYLKDIPGIVIKDRNGKIIINNDCERIPNLDVLDIPDRKFLKLDKYTIPFTICTSRGCPGECIFCSSKSFWGKKVTIRSASDIFKEVMYLFEKYGTTKFYITDDTFTASYKRVVEFCELLKETGIQFLWGCESRADIINEDLIKLLSENGCNVIQFGMESADNYILKKLKKHVTIEQIENAVMLTNKYGIKTIISFIIGHAFDTIESVEKTLHFAEYIQTNYRVNVYGAVNTPFPGTEQFNRADELNIKIYSNDWNQYSLNNPIISTKNLTIDQISYYYKKSLDLLENNL